MSDRDPAPPARVRRPAGTTAVLVTLGAATLVAACAAPAGPGAVTSEAVDQTGSASQLAGPDADLAAEAARAELDPCPPSDAAVPARQDGLPDVTLSCLSSTGTTGDPQQVRLAGLRGKPTVVNVWAQWCPPCRDEAPLLQRLHATAADQLVVLGVNYQDQSVPALAFAAESGLHYPSVSAPGDEFPLRRYAPGPPVTLLVDASGRVAGVVRGAFEDWDHLARTVRQVLGVPVGAAP